MGVDSAQYLRDEVLASAVSDIVNVAKYHARHHSRDTGHFSTPRQVFCYTDHLGFLAYGDKSSTNRFVRFIREFFPPTYEPFAELIVSMWRHGTIHQLKPYSYHTLLRDGGSEKIEVRWLSSNHDRHRERAQHLLVFPMERTPSAVYLVVNNCQLADDLVSAINSLISALCTGTGDVSGCAARIEELGLARSCDDGIKKFMATVLKSQVRRAWSVQGGMLNKSGHVIVKHPDVLR